MKVRDHLKPYEIVNHWCIIQAFHIDILIAIESESWLVEFIASAFTDVFAGLIAPERVRSFAGIFYDNLLPLLAANFKTGPAGAFDADVEAIPFSVRSYVYCRKRLDRANGRQVSLPHFTLRSLRRLGGFPAFIVIARDIPVAEFFARVVDFSAADRVETDRSVRGEFPGRAGNNRLG